MEQQEQKSKRNRGGNKQKPNQQYQNVTKIGDREAIIEGKAKIHNKFYQKTKDGRMVEKEVFYNPPQIFNRDLTCFIIQHFIDILREERKEKFDGITILDGLSASGLRPIRFLKELDGVKKVYANDLSEDAHKQMKENFIMNGLDMSKIEMTVQDAIELMYQSKFNLGKDGKRNVKFDVIDLDPFGTAIPFLDAAINACDDTLLCVTFTDSRILCGQDVNKCFYTYGSARSRNISAYQENSIRVAMYSITSTANKYGKYVEPFLCYQSEFYLRCFLRIREGKQKCWKSFAQIGNLFHCDYCTNQFTSAYGNQRMDSKESQYKIQTIQFPSNSGVCDQCGTPYVLNGPIYLGELCSKEIVSDLRKKIKSEDFKMELKTQDRIIGMLSGMLGELEIGETVCYGFDVAKLSSVMKCQNISKRKCFSALQSIGYKVANSYENCSIVKTNAPFGVIFDMMREFKRRNFSDTYLKNIEPGTPSFNILNKENKITNFDYDLKVVISNDISFLTTQMQSHWGPGTLPKNRMVDIEEQKKIEDQIQKDLEGQNNQDQLIKKLKSQEQQQDLVEQKEQKDQKEQNK